MMRPPLLLLLLLLAAPVAAQMPEAGSPSYETARAAMAELRSPVTPFHTLDMCPSAQAQRDSMYLAAASGMSKEQLVEDFVARHGERVRLLPKRSGFGIWAWIAPPGLLLLGLGFVAARLRRMRGVRTGPAERALTDEERAQLDAALRGFDAEGASA
jgi:cytochrome c-type biogenesis protein CcmH/NrfF